MEQRLYNIEQVAQRLGLATRTVRRYIKHGRFKHLAVLSHDVRDYRYFTEESIQAFLEEYARPDGTRGHYKQKERGESPD